MNIRIGYGYDIHRLVDGNEIILAGLKFKSDKKILAHSDGDIILHSLSQAILSSLGKEDIGYYFPDDKKETENISSKEILLFALEQLKKEDYKINNVVITIITQTPKINPIGDKIKESISNLLNIDKSLVAIHANTKERCGEVGKKEAIECICNLCIIQEGFHG